MKKIISLLPLLTILIVSCSQPESKYKKFTTQLDEYLTGQLPKGEPGGAVLVMKGEEIVFKAGYGLADINTKEPITSKTLFNLGSISKTFVSNAILILQEQGKLSVEDSLYKYFSDFKNKSIAQKVKIKHLLSHTSGLPDNRQVWKDTVFYLSAKDQENWAPVTQTDTLVFETGEHFEYSNPAYNGLALIVEKVSGMKWQQFIAENIFKPSNMLTSTITDGPHPQSGVSHGYNHIGTQWVEDDYGEEPTFAAAGNGGVWSSVEELAQYEIAIENATFLNPETIKQSRTIFYPTNWKSKAAPFIGWSWFIGQTRDSLKTVGHTGSQGGFLCNYVTVPDKKIFFVILCNTPRDVTGITKNMESLLKENNWLE